MNSLSIKQREHLKKIIDGKVIIDSKTTQDFLTNPKVRIALEVIMDNAGLTNERLTKKLSEIINRKPTRSITKTGTVVTNQPAIDANTLQSIRMIWQAKGEFVEKHELGGPGEMKNVPEDQLDKFIAQGTKYLKLRKDILDNNGGNPANKSTDSIPDRI